MARPEDAPTLLAAAEADAIGALSVAEEAWRAEREARAARHAAVIAAREADERTSIRRRRELQRKNFKLISEARAVLAWWVNPLSLITLWRAAKALRRAGDDYRNDLERLASAREHADHVLDHHTATQSSFIADRAGAARHRFDSLMKLLDGGRMAGIRAELEVAAELELLPDTWHVFHNVNLDYGSWIRFDDTHLQTAQIDHVLVGPGGVFVIETKQWSRTFASSGSGFNPYDQVARASYLCFRLLRDDGLETKVMEIIATSGAMPPKPPKRFAAVMPAGQIRGYVTSRRNNLDPVHCKAVAAWIDRRCVKVAR